MEDGIGGDIDREIPNEDLVIKIAEAGGIEPRGNDEAMLAEGGEFGWVEREIAEVGFLGRGIVFLKEGGLGGVPSQGGYVQHRGRIPGREFLGADLADAPEVCAEPVVIAEDICSFGADEVHVELAGHAEESFGGGAGELSLPGIGTGLFKNDPGADVPIDEVFGGFHPQFRGGFERMSGGIPGKLEAGGGGLEIEADGVGGK